MSHLRAFPQTCAQKMRSLVKKVCVSCRNATMAMDKVAQEHRKPKLEAGEAKK